MKSLNKTVALLLTAIIFTLVAGGAYAFLFIVMKNKTKATAELLEKTEVLSGKESRMMSAITTLKNESANIEKLSSHFIKGGEIGEFAEKLEDLGRQSGTTLTLESIDPGVTEKTVEFLSFRIKATGKFADIQRLLVLLENFPGKLEWKTVRLVRDISSSQQVATTTKKIVSQSPIWNVEVFLTAHNFIRE